ncbi:putative nuclease HARBI1 [Linepithema humile]|uniref:putative nuclease HARBI1 n=1 Tax=Linepithema humile TaxID=83485 RepID=UPI00351DF978
MSQASISGTIHIVVEAINQIIDQWIKFPIKEQEIKVVKKQFWDKYQFPGIIGAIDGTHIAIWPPEILREHLYINRKLYHSLNVMLICDVNQKILAVNAGHGGRTHDSRVWNASVVCQHLEQEYRNGRTGAWLIGDSGYPLLPYLLTPMLNQPIGTPSARYTEVHVQARCVIERCIGVLKGRWRCLRKERALHYKPEFAALIVNAACVLHNIAKEYNIPEVDLYVDETDRKDDDFPRDINNGRDRAGQEVREALIRRYFT